MYQTAVSVVVPVRNSERHIRTLVASLANQTVRPYEVILVGSLGDNSWQAVQDYIEQGFVQVVEVANPLNRGGRDSNYKRMYGCEKAAGEVIALTDSKIMLPSNWLETALRLMYEANVMAIGGIMQAQPDQQKTLLVNMLDKGLITEMPRFGHQHFLRKSNFGELNSLPVTSNIFFTKQIFEQIKAEFPVNFTVSYEDYSLAWVLARNDVTIFCTDCLQVFHRHRDNLRANLTKQARAGLSAAQLLKWDSRCPFAIRRALQVALVVLVLFTSLLSMLTATLFTGFIGLGLVLLVNFIVLAMLGIYNGFKAQDLTATTFPAILTLLILVFSWHYLKGLLLIPAGGELPRKMADAYLQIY